MTRFGIYESLQDGDLRRVPSERLEVQLNNTEGITEVRVRFDVEKV